MEGKNKQINIAALSSMHSLVARSSTSDHRIVLIRYTYYSSKRTDVINITVMKAVFQLGVPVPGPCCCAFWLTACFMIGEELSLEL